jgi:4-alpha-glucanotransferase
LSAPGRRAAGYAGLGAERRRALHWHLIRLLMMSAARLVVFPMQDVLGLGAEARMNRPGTPTGNWEWRLTEPQLDLRAARRLYGLTRLYGRR